MGRDRAGRRILKSPPFVSDEASIARLAMGLPVAVRSCWNGLVVMRAAPFVEHGLRFRTVGDGAEFSGFVLTLNLGVALPCTACCPVLHVTAPAVLYRLS